MAIKRLFLTIMCAAVLFGGGVSSAQDGRAITSLPTTFETGLATVLSMPDTGDSINVSAGAQTEPDEPMPSCSGGVLGDYSAWFTLLHPGGTLTINTLFNSGSSYDTVVQVFPRNTLNITDLQEVACNDDFGGPGATDSLISTVLPSAAYLVRVSCKASCAGTPDLALEIGFSAPAGTAPANDMFANAAPITFNKTIKSTGIGFATAEIGENAGLDCDMYHSVWYKFTAPRGGLFTFSAVGSYQQKPFYGNMNTRLAVYRVLPGDPFASFIRYGCVETTGTGIPSGTLTNLLISEGHDIYIRVGTGSNANLLGDSYYQVRVSPESMGSIGVNGTFDSGVTGWTLTGTTAADGIVNTPQAVLRLTGAPGKVSSAKQVIKPADLLLTRAEQGASIGMYVTHNTGGTVSPGGKVVLSILYSDGTTTTKVSAKTYRSTTADADIYLHATFESAKVSKIIIKLQNSSTGGYIDYADVQIFYIGNPARATKQADALPLPPPAGG